MTVAPGVQKVPVLLSLLSLLSQVLQMLLQGLPSMPQTVGLTRGGQSKYRKRLHLYLRLYLPAWETMGVPLGFVPLGLMLLPKDEEAAATK
jgi:hypothetical protein